METGLEAEVEVGAGLDPGVESVGVQAMALFVVRNKSSCTLPVRLSSACSSLLMKRYLWTG